VAQDETGPSAGHSCSRAWTLLGGGPKEAAEPQTEVTHRLELRPEAFADLAEAFSWYETQRTGLGGEFIAQVDRTLQVVAELPAVGRVVHRGLRRALVRRFPFAVYYTWEVDLAEVRAVLHTSRHPETWRRRA